MLGLRVPPPWSRWHRHCSSSRPHSCEACIRPRTVLAFKFSYAQSALVLNGSWGGVEELEAGEGGEGGDLDLVDAMKKLDEKGVKRAMRGLGRDGWKSV